jgi:hypothetical protein
MSADSFKGNLVSLVAASFTAYFAYRWMFGFLNAQVNAPGNFTTFQVLSYTPFGLLLFPMIYLVSGATAAVCALLVLVIVRRKVLPNSSAAQSTEEAPSYSWLCSACGESNLAGVIRCKKCDCRANASGKEIESCRDNLKERNDV